VRNIGYADSGFCVDCFDYYVPSLAEADDPCALEPSLCDTTKLYTACYYFCGSSCLAEDAAWAKCLHEEVCDCSGASTSTGGGTTDGTSGGDTWVPISSSGASAVTALGPVFALGLAATTAVGRALL
jgi:hypothetical protein